MSTELQLLAQEEGDMSPSRSVFDLLSSPWWVATS